MPFQNAVENPDLDPAPPQEMAPVELGVAIVREQIAQFGADSPQRYVAILLDYPSLHDEIMLEIHEKLGMAFAHQVVEIYRSKEDGGGDIDDDGTVDTPVAAAGPALAAAAAAKDEGVVNTDDGLVKDDPASATPKPDDGTVDSLPDDGTVDTTLAAGLDGVETARPEWVIQAEAYNRAHPEHVLEFNNATAGVCQTDSGELDAKKVAEWQSQHGLEPDGKVGKKTIEAAVSGGKPAKAVEPAPPTDDPNAKEIGGG